MAGRNNFSYTPLLFYSHTAIISICTCIYTPILVRNNVTIRKTMLVFGVYESSLYLNLLLARIFPFTYYTLNRYFRFESLIEAFTLSKAMDFGLKYRLTFINIKTVTREHFKLNFIVIFRRTKSGYVLNHFRNRNRLSNFFFTQKRVDELRTTSKNYARRRGSIYDIFCRDYNNACGLKKKKYKSTTYI